MKSQSFICVLRAKPSDAESNAPSPEQMQKMMEAYQKWQEQFADNIEDMGGKLASDGKVVSMNSVEDGPFVELKDIIGGYMFIKADSIDEAVTVIESSPMVQNPAVSIEIRQVRFSS